MEVILEVFTMETLQSWTRNRFLNLFHIYLNKIRMSWFRMCSVRLSLVICSVRVATLSEHTVNELCLTSHHVFGPCHIQRDYTSYYVGVDMSRFNRSINYIHAC